MPLLTSLLILIVTARLLGQVFSRFSQPAIIGEMLAGVLLGPSLLNLITPSPALSGISEFAVFLIVLSAGLEMNFKEVIDSMRGKGAVIALLGFLLPLTGGILVGVGFGLDVSRTVFLGLCVSITALPVTVSILQSFKLLDSTIARYSVATAIFNDIAALLVLGVILNLPEQKSYQAVAAATFNASWKLILLMTLIVSISVLIKQVIQRGILIDQLSEKLVTIIGNEALFGLLLLLVLVFGSVSAALGFHFIIGAFFGALLIDRTFFSPERYKELELTLSSITGGFLAPVFFAYLGLEFKIQVIDSVWFVAVVLVVSIVTKILAGWLGGRLIGLSKSDALGIGFILNGRGVMELVIASIAYERGFIGQDLFSVLVLMGVVTTLITPLMFRKWVMPKLPKTTNTSNP
ncbi:MULTISPECIES: cation:proton antiporter [unclassified Methylophilus]|jgi:Kef-type K+ transport system membrane component KefB|uniref:cation:proton antiporter n=1 Tax=unclassified Methylophilus TaxID=2630143 RepID=UPI00188FED10|nr:MULTISPECIES: cation:proton antiporter [unclassified Methylophilus]MBF5038942.1 cation:proton antiporter [Methylophilus sp. 13]MDF0377103.1 cation:proton antiporter [Methylophilus sp. YYY-1]MDT7850172.1 cation:proton antiporter [Methylophilus sp. VKM B-3414]BEV08383.1 cation:proton antiporter [Methylophilus sp. DW102]